MTPVMKALAQEVAVKRSAGKEGVLASSRELSEDYQYVGAVGEVGYSKLTGLPLDTERRMEGDSGIDFWVGRIGIDVKTARKPYWLLVDENKVRAGIYILGGVSPDCRTVIFHGWAWKSEVLNAPVGTPGSRPDGRIPSHYIQRNTLHDMDELQIRSLESAQEIYELVTGGDCGAELADCELYGFLRGANRGKTLNVPVDRSMKDVSCLYAFRCSGYPSKCELCANREWPMPEEPAKKDYFKPFPAATLRYEIAEKEEPCKSDGC